MVMGCDPGVTGALAFLDTRTGRIVGVHDMPLADDEDHTLVDFNALVALVESYQPDVAMTEAVWGFKANATFAVSYGCLLGAFQYMRRPPLQKVRPQVWQGATFPLAGITEQHDTKKASIFVASKLHPEANLIRGRGRKPDHNLADAVLIAHYACAMKPN
jgi:crossover junction endodeoxyribonuclease RuvC